MNIRLQPMTRELCRIYMQEFEPDKALFADPKDYRPYVYEETACDAYFERQRQLGRIHLAIMKDDSAIGEIILKKIDPLLRHCTLSISLQNDQVKNQGYGTRAEQLALNYAFHELDMITVYADSLLGNLRSQHVLEKVGFRETHRDDLFVYYEIRKPDWQANQEPISNCRF